MAKKSEAITVIGGMNYSPEQIELIKNTVAKGATDDELAMFMHYCKSAGVDPLRKQAHFIVKEYTDYQGRSQRSTNMMIGIDGFQARATSDPRYLGIHAHAVREKDEFEFDVINGGVIHKIKAAERGEIVGAYAVLVRKDMPNACEWVSFKEYNTGKSTWKQIPEVMITKVARAALLRREYPDSFSGVYAPEEFGDEITEQGEYIPLPKDDLPKQLTSKQPTVVKQCKCGNAIPNDNTSGLCPMCLGKKFEEDNKPSEPEIIEADGEPTIIEAEIVEEPKPKKSKPKKKERKAEVDEFESGEVPKEVEKRVEEEQEEPSETYKIKGVNKDTKPRDALDKILEYSMQNQIMDKVKPVIVKHYAAYADGSRYPFHIPEPNVIAIVKELSGMKLKKSEKSLKCTKKGCDNKVTEPEADDQDGLCFDCYMKED